MYYGNDLQPENAHDIDSNMSTMSATAGAASKAKFATQNLRTADASEAVVV